MELRIYGIMESRNLGDTEPRRYGLTEAKIDGDTEIRTMTQDERWLVQWKAVMNFMTVNKRRPSKFVDSERGLRNWWKHQQKLVNAGELKAEEVKMAGLSMEEM